jgi:hypothetical protein
MLGSIGDGCGTSIAGWTGFGNKLVVVTGSGILAGIGIEFLVTASGDR